MNVTTILMGAMLQKEAQQFDWCCLKIGVNAVMTGVVQWEAQVF
jgi:hypothetical protein